MNPFLVSGRLYFILTYCPVFGVHYTLPLECPPESLPEVGPQCINTEHKADHARHLDADIDFGLLCKSESKNWHVGIIGPRFKTGYEYTQSKQQV